MTRAPLVSILTYCAHPALAYGTLLVFKTLRTGFPTARVEVFDNGSNPDVEPQIAAAAASVGADYTAMQAQHYGDHIERLLLDRTHDGAPLVLVDPDVIFWRSVEDWDFGQALMAGRLIPEQREGRYTSLQRLHPSLVWIPSLDRLRAAVSSIGAKWDAIGCTTRSKDAKLIVRDTLAPIQERLGDRCTPFDEQHLDCFDHLFHGAHLPVNDGCDYTGFDAIRAGHDAVLRGDLESVRGIWREQQRYFERSHSPHVPKSQAMANALDCLAKLSAAQGIEAGRDELEAANQAIGMRLGLMRRSTRRTSLNGAGNE